jgi:transposase
MIHPPPSVRLYLAMSPCDMRRSFDGLHAPVNTVLQIDALAGAFICFRQQAPRPREDL